MSDPRPSTSYIEVDGIQLEYQHHPGRDDRPAIVMLHEGLGCVALWRDWPARLAELTERSVYVYSRAGYGQSDSIELPRPIDYMSREAVNVLPVLLQRWAVEEYMLLGHSDGATIALVCGGRVQPPGLQSIVVLAPHVFCEDISVSSIDAIRRVYETGTLREKLKKYHGHNVDCAFWGWCDSWLHPNFRSWSVEPEIQGIRVPVLQIQGRDDEYGTVEQLRRIELLPNADVQTELLDDCGHAPHQDQPAQTEALILAHLAKTAATSGLI